MGINSICGIVSISRKVLLSPLSSYEMSTPYFISTFLYYSSVPMEKEKEDMIMWYPHYSIKPLFHPMIKTFYPFLFFFYNLQSLWFEESRFSYNSMETHLGLQTFLNLSIHLFPLSGSHLVWKESWRTLYSTIRILSRALILYSYTMERVPPGAQKWSGLGIYTPFIE